MNPRLPECIARQPYFSLNSFPSIISENQIYSAAACRCQASARFTLRAIHLNTTHTSSAYKYYVLFILAAVNMFNYVDRNVVSILLVPIKDEFQVSDGAMGLLTGMAFMLVHSLFGIPLARLADRRSRRNVLVAGVAVWSAMTALSGFARSFPQLVALRMGVGIGEAAGSPPAHSMISDYFPPASRALALSLYSVGLYAGIMVGYFAAGWLGIRFGWRTTFIVVGLPGLALSALVALTVREPPRRSHQAIAPLAVVFSHLLRKRSFLALQLAASFHALAAYGAVLWMPTFMHRVHSMPLDEIGLKLGVISGLGGGAGAIIGGFAADRAARRDVRWYAWVAAISALGALLPTSLFLFAASSELALGWFLPYIVLVGMYTGPLFAMNQALAPTRMRATAVAIHLLIVSILGGGVGPWIVGGLSDFFATEYGDDGIRYSMLIVICAGSFLAGVLYLIAGTSLSREIESE